jgi:putative colanic acid biosynthesis acetyltransferase WcaF
METDLSLYTNSWYKPGSKAKRFSWYIANLLFLNTGIPFTCGFKTRLLKLFGAKIGKGFVIKPKVNIKYPWFLTIGNHVWIGENVLIDNLAQVYIGANACISQGAVLLCGNHNYTKTTFDLKMGPITLEEGVWIGAGAIVCPGVTCKSHSVLSVSSVATKDLKAYSIYQGNPAIMIKERVFSV